jgi:hypothetical protein
MNVLIRLGYTQEPNHTTDVLTFQHTQDADDRVVIMKENDMNLDYFHKLLRELQITPVLFARLAKSSNNTAK